MNLNSLRFLKVWVGTESMYNLIQEEKFNTIYIVVF